MLAEFRWFDRKLIHEKYKAVGGGLEKAGFSAARPRLARREELPVRVGQVRHLGFPCSNRQEREVLP